MKQALQLAEKLKHHLLSSIPSAKLASGGSIIVCRCFDCGDSRKSSKSTHMYISMPTEKDPGLYYCHLCHSAGIVTYRKLIEWGIYDSVLANDILIHNNITKNSVKYRKYSPGRIFNIINNKIRNDSLTQIKIQYINNRLGTQLTPYDFLDLKVVLNLNDLLEQNHITKFTRDYNVMQDLDRAFVGFLSLDNGFVTLRRLDDQMVYSSIDSRYINYRIFNKEDTSERFYVVPQKIDLLNPGRIKLHIAEGVFDILSVYLNLRNKENGIYASVSGSNYSSIITYFMMEKMIPNLEVHLYPDNDQSDWKIDKIVKNFEPMRIPIYIHRNVSPNEKDFGVSKDRIIENIRKANIFY